MAIGSKALYSDLTGSYNTAIGDNADVATGNLTNATAVGANAFVSQDSSLILGNAANVGIGTSAPAAKLHVVGRTIIDGDRLEFVNTGRSVFIGEGAGANDDFSDNQNVAVGDSALFNNTTGRHNMANGTTALYYNTGGNFNVANGTEALFNNTTGINNTANGFGALYTNTEGDHNVANGGSSLRINTTGTHNTATGVSALNFNTTGDHNTAIGYGADVSSGNLTNATAIGADAQVSQSNSLVLGNNANVGIGTTAPEAKLHVIGSATVGTIPTSNESTDQAASTIHSGDGFLVTPWIYSNVIEAAGERGAQSTLISVGDDGNYSADDEIHFITDGSDQMTIDGSGLEVFNSSAKKIGGGSWAASSDRRLKQDIRDYKEGLEEVLSVRPVKFRYNELSGYDTEEEFIGVIAQELQEIAPHMVSTFEKDGVDYLEVDNSALTFMLINAIKEQQTEMKGMKANLEALQIKVSEVDILKAENALLKSQNVEMNKTDAVLKAEINNIKSMLGMKTKLATNDE